MVKRQPYRDIMVMPVGRRRRLCEELTRLDERQAEKIRRS
jgi:hypothetical protein